MPELRLALAAVMIFAQPLHAEDNRIISLEAAKLSPGLIETGKIAGYDGLRYRLTAGRGQVLSVDLHAKGSAPDFLIRAEGQDAPLFASDMAGTAVADLPLPADGVYEIEVRLNRAMARKGKTYPFDLAVALNPPDYADGLSGGPDWWQVSGVGPGRLIDVQDGPGPRYAARGKTGDGDVAQNRGCRISLGERWCSVRLAGTGLQGWVAGANLRETAAPPAPEMPEGGPKGNGFPFDATGTVACAPAKAAPAHACPFGVVRDGPGTAGVWVALGDGRERQFSFEAGKLVSSDAAGVPKLMQKDDLWTIEVDGEHYEIPAAVVFGG